MRSDYRSHLIGSPPASRGTIQAPFEPIRRVWPSSSPGVSGRCEKPAGFQGIDQPLARDVVSVRRSASTRIWPLRSAWRCDGPSSCRQAVAGSQCSVLRCGICATSGWPAYPIYGLSSPIRRAGQSCLLTADHDQQRGRANMSFAQVDRVVASAGATHPLRSWLDGACRAGGSCFQ